MLLEKPRTADDPAKSADGKTRQLIALAIIVVANLFSGLVTELFAFIAERASFRDHDILYPVLVSFLIVSCLVALFFLIGADSAWLQKIVTDIGMSSAQKASAVASSATVGRIALATERRVW